MPGIGVVLNPHSKQYKNNPEKLKRMAFIIGDKGSCASTKDLNDIRRVAQEFKDKGIEILALSGGDGTNHVTLTHFIQVYGDQPLPKIAFLKGGTLNTVAYGVGVMGSSEKILSNILYKYHEDEPFETREINIMKVNEQYGFIFGSGVLYRFMEAYYNGGNPSPLKAAVTLVRAIGSATINGSFACRMFERMDAEVTVDGKTWPFKNYSALYGGSVPYLGLGFKVFYLAQGRQIHGIGFSLQPRKVLKYVPFMFFGVPSKCPDLTEQAASEIVIRFAEPQPYTIDGDMHPPVDKLVITTGPRLTIIMR